ncbi:SigB/SigF/SigG family RNA polymerase sigma factor [Streptomyces sp. NPDC059650]|uniref:SigB/SigF/SigG family RNA polymerase sigma factor n=1 Tax=Streptomyces sp. NPDC059650 TaxID=3346896 RepID=UPI00368C6A15
MNHLTTAAERPVVPATRRPTSSSPRSPAPGPGGRRPAKSGRGPAEAATPDAIGREPFTTVRAGATTAQSADTTIGTPRAAPEPGGGAAPATRADALADLPSVPDPRSVPYREARELTRALLVRMAGLEEGTPAHSRLRGMLVELNLSLVKLAARRFTTRTEPQDDILQVGTIGLIKAIDRFDIDRGVELATFAMPTIVGEIKRFFRDATWAVHVPRRLQELRSTLVEAHTHLEQQLDRAPTVAELAEHLSLSREEVTEGLTASNAYAATSLDTPSEDDGALERSIGFEDTRLLQVEENLSLKPLIAALPERERVIIHLRFTEEMIQSAIADRLGISQMHVSRLLSRALTALRTNLTVQSAPPGD